MATSSKSTDSAGNPRDLHAEREQAVRDNDTAKVAKLDAEIAEQQNPSQPGSVQQ